MNEIISTTILLILIMDPLGNLPIFMTVLKHLEEKRRKVIVIREMIIALIVMLLFLFVGEKILIILNLKTETVSISGGIILFLIAIKMIFPSEEDNNNISSNEEPFLVPLAIPLVAGPSLLATLMLLSHQYLNHMSYLVGSLLIAWCFTVIILLLSGLFLKLFGSKGVSALERLMGLVLIMLSTQMFLDGIEAWFKN
ncbi:YhgN family NAAT transporter [Buchnera aphidicola (Brevicoryne brassicae)]|uniref:YhgN family NAAT transporter n=1 Tax=Buchnera aphidicola TaxID=9 RepID=UPI0010C52E63|nr:YhgN family NAAT transporter [Buchnera aphidicola]QCI20001.1 YhgN family NAAT transporter [Buchnera aphidicola (Brevicoryne brassicae)]